jgi:hypothetical protein
VWFSKIVLRSKMRGRKYPSRTMRFVRFRDRNEDKRTLKDSRPARTILSGGIKNVNLCRTKVPFVNLKDGSEFGVDVIGAEFNWWGGKRN